MKALRILLVVFFIPLFGWAAVPPKPNPERMVNTFSKYSGIFIDQSQAKILEEKLRKFSNETSNQITVVIDDNEDGMEMNDLAKQIGIEWGVGGKENNGIVLLICPKEDGKHGKIAISIGYGLEAVLPDLMTKKIREKEMVPYFKEGNYYQGIENAVNALMKASVGAYNVKNETEIGGAKTIFILVIMIIVMLVFMLRRRKGGMSFHRTGYHSTGFFPPFFGGGGSSSGGFSSSNDSSWGGFGGGDFGGGGSSGDW